MCTDDARSWGAGGWLQLGGPHSHPNPRSLRGAFGSFDLPLVAEHHGHGVRSPDLHLKGFEGCGLGAVWTVPTCSLSPWRKGLLSLIVFFFFLMK